MRLRTFSCRRPISFGACGLAAFLAQACVSGSGADPAEEPLAADAPPPAADAAPSTLAATAGDKAADAGVSIVVGPLLDEDLRHVVWKAMEARITRAQKLDTGAEEAFELGDFNTFHFTVTKTLNGSDDISGEATQLADGLEVEATGWYKKTSSPPDSEPKATCYSFDAPVPLTHRGGAWTVPDAFQIAFAREDQEDCY